MTEVRSQRITLAIIIIGWSVVITLLLFTTEYFSRNNIQKIEYGSALRMQSIVKNYIDHVVAKAMLLSYTLSDDDEFKKSVIAKDIKFPLSMLKNNSISGLYIIDDKGGFISANDYDLESDYYTHTSRSFKTRLGKQVNQINLDESRYLIKKFKKNDFSFILRNDDYSQLFIVTKMFTYSGFIGDIVLKLDLGSFFYRKLSKALDTSVSYLSVSRLKGLEQPQRYNKIINALRDDRVYLFQKDKSTFTIFYPQRDLNSNLIGAVRIDVKRGVFLLSEKQNRFSQIVLLILSILGVIAMSLLVRGFFKRQLIITLSFERFFPRNLLSILRKKSILDVHLGDVSAKKVTVLFLDIRKFTTISEKMSAEENFNFINNFLKYLAPLIDRNDGYIDKYIGDAIMALFTDPIKQADNALAAAFQILECLGDLNNSGLLGLDEPVSIGIGVNTGELMIGILGTESRLSGTAIGDTVNTASRIEGLTKNFSLSLLISQSCLDLISDKSCYIFIKVDEVKIRGKEKMTPIYTVEKK